ncbi:hypothetical protein KJ780_01645 [Candidatus Micrarchaeota archaeon]|nr:hypothetical protein [Candidatus Micrarchaeota archaeon]
MNNGVIIRVRGKGPFEYLLHDGMNRIEFKHPSFFHKGSSIQLDLSKKTVTVKEIPDIFQEVESKIEQNLKLKRIEVKYGSAELEAVSRRLFSAQELQRAIYVKFHGDADGISGALILNKFLPGFFMKQGAAVYSVGDAMRDMERMSQEYKPLLILVDTGSGQDSHAAISLMKSAGIEVLSIDHHPIYAKSKPIFSKIANPWNTDVDDPSSYPAGYLCAKIATMLGIESDGLERIACAGDKSQVLKLSKDDEKKALVLDFAATYSAFGSGLDFYSNLLANKQLLDSVLLQAEAKLEETKGKLKGIMKEQKTKKALLYTFNLDSIAERREFPTKGKITGVAFDIVNKNKAILVIGWGKKSIIFRMNDVAVKKGLGADQIIKHIKSSLVDFVENGGGHARAAALRIREGYENIALQEIIAYLNS